MIEETNTELFCRSYPDSDGNTPQVINRKVDNLIFILEPFDNCIQCDDFSISNEADLLGSLTDFLSLTFIEAMELGNNDNEKLTYLAAWNLCHNLDSLNSIISEMYNV